MICLDELGPLEIRPQPGTNWRPRGKPNRFPATYRRTQGVRYLFAWYDVHGDCLYGHIKARKRTKELLQVLKLIRRSYPLRLRLYIILDNLNTHRNQDVRQWARDHNVEFVYTPTYSSWLNRIECHFAPLRKFALTNVYYKDHKQMAEGIHKYIAWRNRDRRNKAILAEQKKVKVA